MWSELYRLNEKYKKLNLHDVIDYEKFCIISIVWHSTKIEGCSLTETDTKVLLENDITAAGKSLRDHLMIRDHFDAFQHIKKYAKQKRKLSPEFIQEIGALVMKNTGGVTNTISGSFDTSKGDLRLAQVYVDKKYFPDFKKVPNLLETLCKSINDKIDSVKGVETLKLAADLHYNFVNIHPFGDGNGRTARLLMNYIQLYHNEPLIKIFTDDRAEYIDALNETEEKKNLDVFREFIGKQEIKFLKAEIDKHKNLNKGFSLMF
ncbi:MAG: Fic family protein [Bacteroidales bacterium]|jgi:Fic family protein|nr:Fic family protein [Bacteroidales bacterium]